MSQSKMLVGLAFLRGSKENFSMPLLLGNLDAHRCMAPLKSLPLCITGSSFLFHRYMSLDVGTLIIQKGFIRKCLPSCNRDPYSNKVTFGSGWTLLLGLIIQHTSAHYPKFCDHLVGDKVALLN